MRYSLRMLMVAAFCMAPIALAGCQTTDVIPEWKMPEVNLNPLEAFGKDGEEEFEYFVPESMAAIWVDSIYSEPGYAPVRGFGGRFYFYNEKGEPVRTEGELTIYAYDDTNGDRGNKIPDRKFVFRETELQAHCRDDKDMGPSYSFWIPWEKLGGQRKTIALLPILKTKEGLVVRGEQSINVLPGTAPDPHGESKRDSDYPNLQEFAARQVAHLSSGREERRHDEQELNRTRLRTTTFSVPRSLEEQMRRQAALRQAQGFVPPQSTQSSQWDGPLTPQPNAGQPAASPNAQAKPEERAPTTAINRTGTGEAPGNHVGAQPFAAQPFGALHRRNMESRQPRQPAFGRPGPIPGSNR